MGARGESCGCWFLVLGSCGFNVVMKLQGQLLWSGPMVCVDNLRGKEGSIQCLCFFFLLYRLSFFSFSLYLVIHGLTPTQVSPIVCVVAPNLACREHRRLHFGIRPRRATRVAI